MNRVNPFVALDGKQYTSTKAVRIVNRGILLRRKIELFKECMLKLDNYYQVMQANYVNYSDFISAYKLLNQLENLKKDVIPRKYYFGLINAVVICITKDEDQEVSKIRLELQTKFEEKSQGRK